MLSLFSPLTSPFSFLLSPLILSSGLRILRSFHGLFKMINHFQSSLISCALRYISYYPIPTKLHIILPPSPIFFTDQSWHSWQHDSCLIIRNAPASSSLPSARLLPLPCYAAVDWWEIIMPMGAPAERNDPACLLTLRAVIAKQEDETSDSVIVISERDEHRARARQEHPKSHRQCARYIRHE